MTHTDTDTRRRTVEPRHARALADHGPGWAIMWAEHRDQPVIVRHEHGDDGTLLEICTHEHMFTLGGDCDTCADAHTCDECLPGGQPNFEVIADHMTDILCDYYPDRTDIAAYMPLTLPYTRALTAYGYQRRFQGNRYYGNLTRHHDAFSQLYRSPDDHLVRLIIPLTPADAPTPAPPLTIEWTYLGRIGPNDTCPVTDLPADTPPADVAELIAAHVAIHPPTPTASDETTDRTGGMGVSESADTPATA